MADSPRYAIIGTSKAQRFKHTDGKTRRARPPAAPSQPAPTKPQFTANDGTRTLLSATGDASQPVVSNATARRTEVSAFRKKKAGSRGPGR